MLVLVAAVVAASPGVASGAGAPVPVIFDTDMYSSVDDVGALAVTLALQTKGEARLLAVGINTRVERPSVPVNAWKCSAAIVQWYRSPGTAIGTDLPNDNTWNINDPDFIGPCAAKMAASTPAPENGVSMYRRVLAGQADGSVAVISTGYLGLLSKLLNSPADSISSLTGRQLIAAKVKRLDIMGGGFPSRARENNLAGDPAAAQNVANNWPTKIVWAGYEVGDAVHTGQTIPSKHPVESPVRVAYGAFVTPGAWYYSYDLISAYHAIRDTDPVLTEVGPGKNTVDGNGGNSFALGTGNQYYLTEASADATAAAIEDLFSVLPPTTAPLSLTATPGYVGPGAQIQAAWTGVDTPTSTDWIGVYKQGAADTAASKWLYTSSCTQTAGTAKASGSCTITMPTTTGNYELRLFKNNGYTKLITSSLIAVGASGGTGGTGPATLTGPASVAPGAPIVANWSGVPTPAVKDWVGLFLQGAADTAAVVWAYDSSCTPTAGTTAKAAGTCTFAAPATAGTYELRLFKDNSYTRLATSAAITVGTSGGGTSGGTAAVSGPASASAGTAITVTFSGVTTPAAKDWIGLYKQGTADTAALKWFFTSSCTQTAGTAKSSGSCSLTMPTTTGNYELRLFKDNGYTKLATSGLISVGAASGGGSPGGGTATISSSASTVARGGTITASWSNVSTPAVKDWIGLYRQGQSDAVAISWLFTSSCKQTAGTSAKASGSCSMKVPTTAGTYELRLFRNNGYTKIATSSTFTVQ